MGDEFDLLLGQSRVMADLRAAVRRLAQRARVTGTPPAVLILGETGTGKGLLANLLHRVGPRATGPLLDLNCASIPEPLLESELFGYERGAFTGAGMPRRGLFQAAHGGTLFLDEIGLLSPALQAKLLKAVEDRSVRRLGGTRSEPVDVWIIGATNEDLREAVRQRRFREDLYHRLAVVTLTLPPLRERGGDAVLLARHFLERAAKDYRLGRLTLTAAAEAKIATHPWPGNVRELANTIDRTALLAESSIIEEAALELGLGSPISRDAPPPQEPGVVPPRSDRSAVSLESALREHLQAALDRHGGNISRAAQSLGIARNTLRAHIQRLRLRTAREGVTLRLDPDRVRRPERPASRRPLPDSTRQAIPGTQAEVPEQAGPEGSRAQAAAPEDAPLPPGGRSDRPTVLRWERRLLTFLAVSLTPPLGASAFQLAPVLQELVVLLERFGGRVDELAPLRVVGTFGTEPVEDAPRRAAAAALAATKALEREPRGVVARAAIEVADRLVIRAGPITGMDPAERQDTLLTIDDLLASATPGEIVVGPAARPHLDRSFELATRSDLTGRGRAAHRLLPRERSGLLVGGHGPSPFVGRGSDLAMLHEVLDRAERGQGQIVGVVGEPGVGKSRLLHEFRLALRPDRMTYLVGRCVSYGGSIPYLPIVEVLRTAFGVLDGDEFDAVHAKLARGVRATGLEPSTCVPYLLHLLGWKPGTEPLANVSPAAVRERTLETLRMLARAASRTRPTVCAIEDLHWIDPSSEEALTRLVDGLSDSAVLVLATYRPGYRLPWLGRSYAHQIGLRRLTAAESLVLLKAQLPEACLTPEVAARLIDQADGIPFHLEELARAVADHGRTGASVAVPETLQGVLAARLGRLEPAQRELLQAAAVMGREFSSAMVAEVVGRPAPQIDSELDRLQAAEFVVETLEGPVRTYRFRHVLTQEVAYRTLLDPDRQALHARVAAAIEICAPDTADRRPEILARHYTQGGRLRQAIAYWARAGRLSLGRSALVEAVAHLRQGLQLVELLEDTPERAREELAMQLDLGTALAAQRGYAAPEVAEPLARARVLADQLGDARELFPVRWALWRFAFSRADYGTARVLANQLRDAVAGPDGDDLRTVAELASGAVHFYRGEFADADRAFESAWQAHTPARARSQILLCGQDLGAAARAFQAWGQAIGAELDRSAQTGADALQAARVTGHPFSIGFTLYLVAWATQLRGDVTQLRALGTELAALAEQYSFKLLTAFGLMVSGWAAWGTGDLEQAVTSMSQGAELFRAVGQRAGLFHRALLADALVASGAADRADEVLGDALAQAESVGEEGFLAELHRIRGDARVRRKDVVEAEICYRRALEIAARQEAWLLAVRAAAGRVRLVRVIGASPGDATRELATILRRVPAGADYDELRAARALVTQQTEPVERTSQVPQA